MPSNRTLHIYLHYRNMLEQVVEGPWDGELGKWEHFFKHDEFQNYMHGFTYTIHAGIPDPSWKKCCMIWSCCKGFPQPQSDPKPQVWNRKLFNTIKDKKGRVIVQWMPLILYVLLDTQWALFLSTPRNKGCSEIRARLARIFCHIMRKIPLRYNKAINSLKNSYLKKKNTIS